MALLRRPLVLCLNNLSQADQSMAGSDDSWVVTMLMRLQRGAKLGKSCVILHGFLIKGDQVTNHF